MKQRLSRYDRSGDSPRVRQRRAAHKAWRTIKKNQQLSASKDSLHIDRYLSLNTLSSLAHPEETSSSQNQTNEILSYSRGIVSLFHKTPSDIACGRFWEIRWAYGCPLDCNYCYLRGTMKGNMKPSPLKISQVLDAITVAFQNIKEPSIFNTGELSDSLMYPSLMEKIIDRFEEQNNHKVSLLSKMGRRNIDFLLEKPRKQTICAWSINASEVSKRWEKAAPPPEDRIQSAKLVSDANYDTRVRLDPIFPIENWKVHYGDIINQILTSFTPKKIILGTPRGLWKTLKYARAAKIDMSWSQYFQEDSGWGKKLPFSQRKEIYEFLYDKLKASGYPSSNVSMCKETVSMWKEMKLPYDPLTCNCYGKGALDP